MLSSGWLPEFLSQDIPATPWLIHPFIPLGGTVFFHGPTSVGKSPFTWKLATSVSNGTDFFGYRPALMGPVLYLELDTPANLLHDRLSKLEDIPQRMFLEVWSKPVNITNPTPSESHRLHVLADEVQPVLVIINTLRKAHTLDDKSSEAPSAVYGAWRKFFPSSTLFFVHHDKKDSSDPYANPDQAFSGNQHWADDAQVALHITRMGKPPKAETAPKATEEDDEVVHEKMRVRVKMTKSQVSDHELHSPLILQLSSDGTNWLEAGPSNYRRYFRSLPLDVLRKARIVMVMEKFGIRKSVAYEACKGLS